MKSHYLLLCSLFLFAAGCNEALPDGPPPMDLEAEKAIVEKNMKMEIDYIMSDNSLSPEEKEKLVAEVKAGGEGYLKAFEESKRVRDEQYGTAP